MTGAGPGDDALPPHDGLRARIRAVQGDARLPADIAGLLRDAAAALDRFEADLAVGQQRYRSLFDAVPDPVSVLSRAGVVLDVNRAAVEAYQRPREEIIGRSIDLLNPDLPEDHLVAALRALEADGTYVIEVHNQRADGSRFPVEVHSANVIHDGERAIIAVARDLSARQAADARYRSLVESIDQAITVQDPQGRVHYFNAAAARIYGIGDGGEEDGLPDWDDWLVVDDLGRPLPFDDYPASRAIRDNRVVSGVVLGLFRRSSTRMLWLSITAIPQFAPGTNQCTGILTLANDVTILQRDKSLFQRVQELAQIGAWQWDRGSGELHLTAEARRIIDAPNRQPGIAGIFDALCPPDRLRLDATLAQIRGATGLDLELEGRHLDGAPFWLRMIGEPDAHDPGGERLSGTLQDVTERRQAEERLRQLARTDALTGLANRHAILEHVQGLLSDPAGRPFAILYVDLDRFKIVNDMLGHDAGDRLLLEAADRIRLAVGDGGVIARFGGDEFLIACDAMEEAECAARLAQSIQAAFATPFRIGSDEFNVTTSIGIAHAPADGDTPKRLIQSADVAMYYSKRRRRNGAQAFSAELATRHQERLQTESRLRRALDNSEFHLVYQPQVDIRTGRILSAEALLRWNSPQLGEMSPDSFIALAESTGEIVRIGHWVLGEACKQMRRWQEQGLAIERIAVNVSYRQFIGEDLAASVGAMLAEAGLPGHALELELTERVLVEDHPDNDRSFDALRALGVRLSIDDFGEGYSALNYLRRLPIHALKLSRDFLKGVPASRSDVAICQAVAGIARSLGLALVAEGVETEAQRDFLLRLGVNIGQGFLYAPGLLPGEFARRLAAQG